MMFMVKMFIPIDVSDVSLSFILFSSNVYLLFPSPNLPSTAFLSHVSRYSSFLCSFVFFSSVHFSPQMHDFCLFLSLFHASIIPFFLSCPSFYESLGVIQQALFKLNLHKLPYIPYNAKYSWNFLFLS